MSKAGYDKYKALTKFVLKQTPTHEDAPETLYNLMGLAASVALAGTGGDLESARNLLVTALNLHLTRFSKIKPKKST